MNTPPQQRPTTPRPAWNPPRQLRVLDLCCGRGGVARALADLPIEVVGVDCEDYSDEYPGQFIQADALSYRTPVRAFAADLVWASPPCTAYSSLSPTAYGSREAALAANPRITEALRETCRSSGAHYVIENVPGASRAGELDANVTLNGLAFGEDYRLTRHFETSFDCPSAAVDGEPGLAVDTRGDQSVAALADAKDVPAAWGKQGVRSAMPPVYVRWLLAHAPLDLSIEAPDRLDASLAAFAEVRSA